MKILIIIITYRKKENVIMYCHKYCHYFTTPYFMIALLLMNVKYMNVLNAVTLYCAKRNFNFVERKHGRSSCVAVQSRGGDLFELIPIPLEPRGQSGERSREEAACGGGGWIFLCNLPERFKNPGDPAIYLALCYAEPRQRKIDSVTASNPLLRPAPHHHGSTTQTPYRPPCDPSPSQ